MPISEARVVTAHGSRYLQQLCKHWAHKFTVDVTPEWGTVDLGEGRVCAMSAADDALTLRATVAAGGDIAGLERVIAEHVQRFAFREELAFAWAPLGD